MAAVRLSIRIKQTWLGGDEGCNARDNHGGFLKQNCFNDVKVLLDCSCRGGGGRGFKANFFTATFFRVIFLFCPLMEAVNKLKGTMSSQNRLLMNIKPFTKVKLHCGLKAQQFKTI